jgi:hypothetical protein
MNTLPGGGSPDLLDHRIGITRCERSTVSTIAVSSSPSDDFAGVAALPPASQGSIMPSRRLASSSASARIRVSASVPARLEFDLNQKPRGQAPSVAVVARAR